MHIKNQRELLQQIAAGVNKHEGVRVANLKVTLQVDPVDGPEGQDYEFGLAQALDCLANDIYWDERGNWSEARVAKVETY